MSASLLGAKISLTPKQILLTIAMSMGQSAVSAVVRRFS